ncbi:hypothetical protein PESP_a3237 [Pseudoalteromonas espejiana DSM 9414]|uniref:Uncharacterized protein n=1 Tax=Pseudoalteromonas espejiana TaxID=28107 RepID=A0A510Y3A1_9GAMM|nr:hypothetical protein [Pseudoalteromonas espejiana]ASM51082.1 hypothetical protein PESP_a3237 [Pseudoalteromonas espejiana DSM 9414]GEK57067.1 hypothetical protein PES01_39120 [Pseudoalteromonas espejiana]
MMLSIFLMASLSADFHLAGKTSAGLMLCENLNNKATLKKIKEYSKLHNELNSYLSSELESNSDLSNRFYSAQVDFINSFENADKEKSLDESLLTTEKCQIHINNANQLIKKFQ